MKLKQLIDSLNEIVEAVKTDDIEVFVTHSKLWKKYSRLDEIVVYKKYDNTSETISISVDLCGEQISKDSDDQD